jgi:hypothetical protein
MSAVKNAFENLGKDIEHAFQAVGEVAKGVLTLDFDEVGKGVKDLGSAALDAGRNMIDLSPVGLAANTLMDGALDKGLKAIDNQVEKVADNFVDGMANDLDTVKNGVEEVGEGLLTGNLSEMGKGLLDTAVGGFSTFEDFTPEGAAMNAFSAVGETAVDDITGSGSDGGDAAVDGGAYADGGAPEDLAYQAGGADDGIDDGGDDDGGPVDALTYQPPAQQASERSQSETRHTEASGVERSDHDRRSKDTFQPARPNVPTAVA